MVPLDVMDMDGCGWVALPISNDVMCVQSYCARPCVAPASNRKPPVMRRVVVMLDVRPSALRTIPLSPVIVKYGSPWIVTLSDRQALNSVRVDVVTAPDGAIGAAVIVIVTDPPPGQVKVITLDKPSGVALNSTVVACVSVAPTMPCVVAGLTLVGGVTVEGADGELPPHPAARPARMRGAMNRGARIGPFYRTAGIARNTTEGGPGAR
jgi:hypothetical protein